MNNELMNIKENYPKLYFILEKVIGKFAFFESDVLRSYHEYNDEFLSFGEKVSNLVMSIENSEERLENAIKGYIKFSFEYIKLQKDLNLSGRYLHSSFEDTRREVYHNSEVMEGYYLSGLLLSSFLWYNHYKIFNFFQNNFIPRLDKCGSNLEIGTGHGLFTSLFLDRLHEWITEGIDISQYSLDYTKLNLDHFKIEKSKYHLDIGDIMQLNLGNEMFDSVVCGEVLEHIEDPIRALGEIHRVLKPNGKCFLTTAAFAASIDHIFMFESVDDIREVLTKSEFKIEAEEIICIGDKKYQEGMTKVPIDYAAIIIKA